MFRHLAALCLIAATASPDAARALTILVQPSAETVRPGETFRLDFSLDLGPTELVRGVQLEFLVDGAEGPVTHHQVPSLLAGPLQFPWGLTTTVAQKAGSPPNEVTMVHANSTDQSRATIFSVCPLSLLVFPCEFSLGGVSLVAGPELGPIEIEFLSPPNTVMGLVSNICSNTAEDCLIENDQRFSAGIEIVPEPVPTLLALAALAAIRCLRGSAA